MDFEKIRKEALDKIAKKEIEVQVIRDALKNKENELDKFREEVLINLMHHDKNAITEDEEDPCEGCEDPFTFLDTTPNPLELDDMKSIVIHFKPTEEEDGEFEPDNIHVAVECGLDDESVVAALAFALMKAIRNDAISQVDVEEEKQIVENLFKDDKLKVMTARLIEDACNNIFNVDLDDALNNLFEALFGE